MGGIFSPPSPPAPTPVVETTTGTEAEDRARRLQEIDRRRRGRSGTVETGWRGVLSQPANTASQSGTKTRLGE